MHLYYQEKQPNLKWEKYINIFLIQIMAKNKRLQKYRAGVGALILNDKNEILMVQNRSFREDEWDFVKGGMHMGETELDTLNREITEELGADFKFDIIRRSSWNVIYEWPIEKQIEKGFRGQARVSYWLMYNGGEINIDTEELRAYKWVSIKNYENFLKDSGWTVDQYAPLVDDLNRIKQEIYK
jgi:putative (di)nucleoside polyphosphate hydrolase